jgi:microcystin degradation protein MlrC
LPQAHFLPGEAAFGWMYDPEVLKQAMDAGIGSQIQVTLGGKLDVGVAGDPIKAIATVKTLTDGHYMATPGSAFAFGRRNLGPIARLVIGNVDVLVNGHRQQVRKCLL